MPTTKIADKETLDTINTNVNDTKTTVGTINTNVSSVVNKLPSGNIADASTLSTVNSNVTYIKNNLPSGGGGFGLVLKCTEVGSVPASGLNKTVTATYGGICYVKNTTLANYARINSVTADGVSGCQIEVGASNIWIIPFKSSITLTGNSATYGASTYCIYKYEKVT